VGWSTYWFFVECHEDIENVMYIDKDDEID